MDTGDSFFLDRPCRKIGTRKSPFQTCSLMEEKGQRENAFLRGTGTVNLKKKVNIPRLPAEKSPWKVSVYYRKYLYCYNAKNLVASWEISTVCMEAWLYLPTWHVSPSNYRNTHPTAPTKKVPPRFLFSFLCHSLSWTERWAQVCLPDQHTHTHRAWNRTRCDTLSGHILHSATNSFQTSGDALRADHRAGHVLDCWTARDMFRNVHSMSWYLWPTWRIKISVRCVLVGQAKQGWLHTTIPPSSIL